MGYLREHAGRAAIRVKQCLSCIVLDTTSTYDADPFPCTCTCMLRREEGAAGISLRAPSFNNIKMRARSYTYEQLHRLQRAAKSESESVASVSVAPGRMYNKVIYRHVLVIPAMLAYRCGSNPCSSPPWSPLHTATTTAAGKNTNHSDGVLWSLPASIHLYYLACTYALDTQRDKKIQVHNYTFRLKNCPSSRKKKKTGHYIHNSGCPVLFHARFATPGETLTIIILYTTQTEVRDVVIRKHTTSPLCIDGHKLSIRNDATI
jgi:hypothetical protein